MTSAPSTPSAPSLSPSEGEEIFTRPSLAITKAPHAIFVTATPGADRSSARCVVVYFCRDAQKGCSFSRVAVAVVEVVVLPRSRNPLTSSVSYTHLTLPTICSV